MARKVQTLYLHCKCKQCTHWEILAEVSGSGMQRTVRYFLLCKTCQEKVAMDGFYPEQPHALIHWEEKE